MQTEKSLWYQVSDQTTPDVLASVFNGSYSTLFVQSGDHAVLEQVQLPQRMDVALGIHSLEELERWESHSPLAARTSSVLTRDPALVDTLRKRTNYKTGVMVDVNDGPSLGSCVENAKIADLLLIDFKDPTNIPLELVLATTQATDTKVFKKVKHAQDGEVSVLTMESGSDGILLQSDDLGEITRLSRSFEHAGGQAFTLEAATVVDIAHSGMGDRACIDTTSELFSDEGMLIGSTSTGGLMVCSETHYLPYMNLRPFRVNAGGIHSYVWGPDNFVPYLSDLRAGDRVYAVNAKGHARVVTVGRVKIERRPLLKIATQIQGKIVNVFIQDDWHVRMFGAGGEIRPSSEIRIGDKLLGRSDIPGRHVGIKISESIREV